MSSASEFEPDPVAVADNNTRRSSRHRSSTPQSPRKRPRVRSTDSSRVRNHKVLRRSKLEAKYNDAYRLLFNEHVTQAAARFDVAESGQYYSKHVGSTVWSPEEQGVFFAVIERLGPHDISGIARAIPSKTAVEIRAFLVLLQGAVTQRGDANVTLRDIPAAIEVGDACHLELEEAGDALAWYQERHEAFQEQARYGEYWLITPSIAEEIEDAYSGSTRPRPASTTREHQLRGFGSGIAGACERCKTGKKKCDRQMPSCFSCTRSKVECVYPESTPRVADRSRASPPQGYELQKSGNGMLGACVICKKRKRRCDRRIPCSYCAQTNTHCVYVQNPLIVPVPDLTPSRLPLHAEGVNMQIDESRESRVLQAITEANLLDPKVMLTLSKEIFMNRSAKFPSPWMHWSQYSSELASEPSIYRSAFNDFHRLALSVTKRLTQIAIIQATSRLRAQRVRGKKGVLPLVRKRDIFTAIDVLGMRRNGNERWQGVARRCGLKVVSSRKSPKGKITREVPWSEVESIMSPVVRSETQPIRKAETDTEPDKFKSRVARTGTPLPMHSLTLTDAEDDHDSENEDAERSSDDELHLLAHRNVQRTDLASTHTSVSPTTRIDKVFYRPHTLEGFDQEASRQEERALWDMLGLAPVNQIISTKPDNGAAAPDSEIDEIEEGIVTEPEGWRQSMDYKPMWETYDDAYTSAKFFMNSKPLAPMRATRATRSNSATDPFDDMNYNSSTSGSTRPRRRPPVEIELQARGTNAYAALQRHEVTHAYDTNYISNAENEELEQDIPTQSIEAGLNAVDFESPESDMDWV